MESPCSHQVSVFLEANHGNLHVDATDNRGRGVRPVYE